MSPAPHRRPRLLLLGDAGQVHLRRWAGYFDAEGYNVFTLSLEAPDGEYPGRFERIEVTTSLPHALRYPLAVPRARRLASSFDPDVVNAHFVPNYGLIASFMGRAPWVLSTWGSDVMTDPDKTAFHMWRTRRVLSRAAWVTSDARVMTERLVQLGVAPERILTFPYGVDTSRFRPAADTPEGGPRIVTNRKLEPVYSVSTVVDAFGAVSEAFPDATLTVAGDGSERRRVAQRAAESAAAASIAVVGGVDHEHMPALLAGNQVYVSASRSDTTSVSLLEAMASGLFPVVTDIPANREWVSHGENGMLFPAGRPTDLAAAIIEAWRCPGFIEDARRANLALIRDRAQWADSMRPVHELFIRIARDA